MLDASGTRTAVLVGLCGDAVWRAVLLAGRAPERVAGIVAFAPGVPLLTDPHPWRVEYSFQDELPTDEGWAKLNRHYWRRDYPGFIRFFFGEVGCEPHSTKVVDDTVQWAAVDGSMEAMLADMDAPSDRDREEVVAAALAVALPDAARARDRRPLPAAVAVARRWPSSPARASSLSMAATTSSQAGTRCLPTC